MKIQTIKFYKNKETGALYGMRTNGREDALIPDPAKAWRRLSRPGKNYRPVILCNMITVDYPDELVIYIKND